MYKIEITLKDDDIIISSVTCKSVKDAKIFLTNVEKAVNTLVDNFERTLDGLVDASN